MLRICKATGNEIGLRAFFDYQVANMLDLWTVVVEIQIIYSGTSEGSSVAGNPSGIMDWP
jgi:hypothetical protein